MLVPDVAQQQQRLLHRLARDAQRPGDLLLDDPLAGRELARGDLAQDRVAHLLDAVGGQRQRFHAASVVGPSNVEFRIHPGFP
jgi:hypothetical protein